MGRIDRMGLILFPMLIIASGCISAGNRKDVGERIRDSVMIKPSTSYEDCIEVLPDQKMLISFDASDSINFNVHYHAEHALYYPVNKSGVRIWTGSLDPVEFDFYTEAQESFCVMWENIIFEPVRVSFDIKAVAKQ